MYSPEDAASIAQQMGLPSCPAWLSDLSVTFEQWCATNPMQAGPMGPDGVRIPEPIPAEELATVWRCWQYRRAQILARHWLDIELFEVLNPAIHAARLALGLDPLDITR